MDYGKKFAVQLDLSQIGGKDRMINALVIIQVLGLKLNYRKPVKIIIAREASDQQRTNLFCCGEGDCRQSKRICKPKNS